MSTQHTPGPWHIDAPKYGTQEYIKDAGNWLIASVHSSPYPSAPNARLIAAAPDLLAALREAQSFLRALGDAKSMAEVHDLAVNVGVDVEDTVNAAVALAVA